MPFKDKEKDNEWRRAAYAKKRAAHSVYQKAQYQLHAEQRRRDRKLRYAGNREYEKAAAIERYYGRKIAPKPLPGDPKCPFHPLDIVDVIWHYEGKGKPMRPEADCFKCKQGKDL